MDYGAIWDRSTVAQPLTDKQLVDAEARWNVRFPATLVALLKAQNGGGIRHRDEVVDILPLRPDQVDHPSSFVIMSLDDYAVRGWMLDESGLDSVRDELGDPNRVLALNSDGHVCVALNFNGSRPGEPSIWRLDFEGCSSKQIAPSFDAWLAKLTGAAGDSASRSEDLAEPEPLGVADNLPGSESPPALGNAPPPPSAPGGPDDLEQAFAAMSGAVDDVTTVMGSITNAETAKALQQDLLKKAQAYKAAADRMYACVSTSGLNTTQIGTLALRYQFPQARVGRALMQLRVRGPEVYRIVRASIKLLDEF